MPAKCTTRQQSSGRAERSDNTSAGDRGRHRAAVCLGCSNVRLRCGLGYVPKRGSVTCSAVASGGGGVLAEQSCAPAGQAGRGRLRCEDEIMRGTVVAVRSGRRGRQGQAAKPRVGGAVFHYVYVATINVPRTVSRQIGVGPHPIPGFLGPTAFPGPSVPPFLQHQCKTLLTVNLPDRQWRSFHNFETRSG